jgi:hypothetical protein
LHRFGQRAGGDDGLDVRQVAVRRVVVAMGMVVAVRMPLVVVTVAMVMMIMVMVVPMVMAPVMVMVVPMVMAPVMVMLMIMTFMAVRVAVPPILPAVLALMRQHHVHPQAGNALAHVRGHPQFELVVQPQLRKLGPQVVGLHAKGQQRGKVHVAADAREAVVKQYLHANNPPAGEISRSPAGQYSGRAALHSFVYRAGSPGGISKLGFLFVGKENEPVMKECGSR